MKGKHKLIIVILLLVILICIFGVKKLNDSGDVIKYSLIQYLGGDYDYKDYELYTDSDLIYIYKLSDESIVKEDYHLVLDENKHKLVTVSDGDGLSHDVNLIDTTGKEVKENIRFVIYNSNVSYQQVGNVDCGTTSYLILTDDGVLYSIVNQWNLGANSRDKILMKDNYTLEVYKIAEYVDGILKESFFNHFFILKDKEIVNLENGNNYSGYVEIASSYDDNLDFKNIKYYYFYNEGYVGYGNEKLLFGDGKAYLKFKYVFNDYLVDIDDRIFKLKKDKEEVYLSYIGSFEDYSYDSESKHGYIDWMLYDVVIKKKEGKDIKINNSFIWDGKQLIGKI